MGLVLYWGDLEEMRIDTMHSANYEANVNTAQETLILSSNCSDDIIERFCNV